MPLKAIEQRLRDYAQDFWGPWCQTADPATVCIEAADHLAELRQRFPRGREAKPDASSPSSVAVPLSKEG